MSALADFRQVLNEPERQLLETLTSPAKIQSFLDALPYSTEHIYRCPLRVLRDRIAHWLASGPFGQIYSERTKETFTNLPP